MGAIADRLRELDKEWDGPDGISVDGILSLRNALPELAEVVETAEGYQCICGDGVSDGSPLDEALRRLGEKMGVKNG